MKRKTTKTDTTADASTSGETSSAGGEKVTTPASFKQETPTIHHVIFDGKTVGKIGAIKGGFRFFGDPEARKFGVIEAAANALLAHHKIDVSATPAEKATGAGEKGAGEGAAPKADPAAELRAKASVWLAENLPEQADAYLPVFVQVLLSLRTRKKFLKDIEDLELAQAMYDFEAAVMKRSRQLKHLLSKVNGLARRGGGNKKLTLAQQLGDLLTNGIIAGFDVAPDGEQPKQLSVRIVLGDGLYTVKLTVREIEAAFPEVEPEADDDNDDIDDAGGETEDDAAPAAE